MREVKVLKLKEGRLYLVSFDYDGGPFCMRNFDSDSSVRAIFDRLFKSTENAQKALKRTLEGSTPSIGNRLIMSDSSVPKNDEEFVKWKDKMLKMLARRCEVHDPLVLGDKLIRRAKTLGNEYNFTLNLANYRDVDEEKVPVTFMIKPFMNYAFPTAYDHRCQSSQFLEHQFIGCVPDKFNYLTYDDNKIFFNSKKEVGFDELNAPRQSTKVSKIIKDLYSVANFQVSIGNSAIIHTYSLSENQRRGDDAAFNNEATVVELDVKWMNYYIEKGMSRLWELMISDFKPKTFKYKTTKNIEKIYGVYNAEKGSGTLGSSCMSAHNRTSYTCAKQSEFYNYLDGCKILYSLDERGGLYGRALIWKGKHRNKQTRKMEPFTFLDRIYGSEDFINGAREWAAERNYWWRLDQSAGSITLTNKDNIKIDDFETEITQLQAGQINRRVPYFDTLKYFNVLSKSTKYGKLQLSSQERKYSQKMSGTDAAILVIQCEHCGVLHVKKTKQSAWMDETRRTTACHNCSVRFGDHTFIKTKDDIKLTFNSNGYQSMPKLMQADRLVTISVDGKQISFDAQDTAGMRDFFKRKAKKGVNFETSRHARHSSWHTF